MSIKNKDITSLQQDADIQTLKQIATELYYLKPSCLFPFRYFKIIRNLKNVFPHVINIIDILFHVCIKINKSLMLSAQTTDTICNVIENLEKRIRDLEEGLGRR